MAGFFPPYFENVWLRQPKNWYLSCSLSEFAFIYSSFVNELPFLVCLQVSSSDETVSQNDSPDSDDDISEKQDDTDPNFSVRKSRSASKSRLNLSANPDILASLDRRGTSTRAGVRVIAATAGACGLSQEDVTLSKSSVARNRSKFRSKIGM